MYIRKKINKSGSISVQIICKDKGKYKLLKSVGCSKDLIEVEFLVEKAKKKINELEQTTELPFFAKQELEFVYSFVDFIDSIKLVGPELLLGKIFDEIGFNLIKDNLFRHLVITR